MRSSHNDIDKIEAALLAASHQQEDIQFPPDWRQKVMQDIESLAEPASFPKEKKSKTTVFRCVTALAALSFAVFAGWLILTNMDWKDPWLSLKRDVTALESHHNIWLEAGDVDSGLRNLTVTVIQGALKIKVFSKNFEPLGGGCYSPSDVVNKIRIPLLIDAKALGLQEGEALLVIMARDLSWENWFQGRQTILEQRFLVYPDKSLKFY
ncbi:MAG: hypothetical protein P8X65_01920 [Syntrophobacterales bacterium]|jgi:hypothetical protein